MRNSPIAALVLLALACAPVEAAEVCRDGTNAKALDFWTGDWTVRDAKDGSLQGKDRVDAVLGGCAVIENWNGVEAGDEGKSLFSYDAVRGSWEQVWVTRDPSRPGGLKHKHLVATYPDGGVRFQGALDLPDGRVILDRTTLTPLKDGSVHQLIEDSKDGGQTWIASFDAIYARK